MKLGIIIYSNDSESIWNAFRIALHAKEAQDDVTIFLLGKGVESEDLDKNDFKINDYISAFTQKGGRIFACGTCLNIRNKTLSSRIIVGSLNHVYEIIRHSDKTITF